MGILKVMVVPLFGSDSREMVPLWASMTPFVIYSPSPVPTAVLAFLIWVNFEKRRCCLSLGIPSPLSTTLTIIFS